MTPTEAKMRILAEWRTWIGHRQVSDSHTRGEASAFFDELQQNHPDLVSFESNDDKRQTVNRWLEDAGLIK